MKNLLIDYSNQNSLGSRFRRKRFERIESLIGQVLETKSDCSILDIGGTVRYWNLMKAEILEKCTITIVNLEVAKGANPRAGAPEVGEFVFAVGDGRDLSGFRSNQFDIAHSNSVVEHVGTYSDMKRFAAETMRVGRAFYVQTPSIWFPIDPHYGMPVFHWLPLPLRAFVLSRFNVGFQKKRATYEQAMDYVEFVNLLDREGLRTLFPSSSICSERFLFLTKSLISTGSVADSDDQ